MAKITREENKGITLIALVITIIILLILAGISIAMLTGENGILKKADNAKMTTTIEEEKEQIKVAYNAVIMDTFDKEDGGTIVEKLQKEFNHQNTDAVAKSKVGEENKIEVTFNQSKNVYILDVVTKEIIKQKEKPAESEKVLNVEEAKQKEKFDTKTTVQDTFENKIIIPEGFKIASDSANDVTGGVVIEDVSHGSTTAGSQFVWIPVGTVKYSGGTKTINLDRYTFAEDGTPSAQGEKVIDTYYQELAISSYGNATAKDIEAFKRSVVKNGGYYIGRYEARTVTERTGDITLTPVTVKPNDYVYNWIKQPEAATKAREMYNSITNSFTSDLMNSYAWDTAILFLQEFDNRSNKPKVYSRQNSLNTRFAKKGTNHLSGVSQQDKNCNIWDMASNDWEWTTESYINSESPCVDRGGRFSNSSNYMSLRINYQTNLDSIDETFRPLLYLKN